MVIEQISQMKQQGIPTSQIIQNLKQQGISPKEINEALSQSEIKTAIKNNQNVFPGTPESPNQAPNQTTGMQQQTTPQNMGHSSTQATASNAQMQPSIGQQQMGGNQDPTTLNMQPQMQGGMQQAPQMTPPMLEPSTQDYSEYQEYAPEGSGEYYPEYQQGGGADIETINDISSQLIDEKTKHFKKEFSDFISYKKDSQSKLEELDKRLTKIEDHIEELKMAIIRKIGEYGDNIKHLSKDVKATQESFGKIINPLAENAKAAKQTQPTEDKSTFESKTSKSKSDSFEDYIR